MILDWELQPGRFHSISTGPRVRFYIIRPSASLSLFRRAEEANDNQFPASLPNPWFDTIITLSFRCLSGSLAAQTLRLEMVKGKVMVYCKLI